MIHTVFLAIDGVLNSEYYYSTHRVEDDIVPFARGDIDPKVIETLNTLRADGLKDVVKSGDILGIVLLPSWRSSCTALRQAQRRLSDDGLRFPIIDLLKGDKEAGIRQREETVRQHGKRHASVIVDIERAKYSAMVPSKVIKISRHWGLLPEHVPQIVKALHV